MKMVSGNSNLVWEEKSDKLYLKFRFEGFLNDLVAKSMISNWEKEFSSRLNPNAKAIIVWDCLEMTGYSTAARKLWQNKIGEFNNQIEVIWIITNNPIYKLTAKTMSFLTKYNLKSASSESEIV